MVVDDKRLNIKEIKDEQKSINKDKKIKDKVIITKTDKKNIVDTYVNVYKYKTLTAENSSYGS